MRKINEIFYSVQGEGAHVGEPAVFVRFSGCNMHCPFCDTDHSEATPMNDDEIVHAVCLYPARWIVLTGGEPSLWIDDSLVQTLHRATHKTIAIETNGTNHVPEGIDWITLSPKTDVNPTRPVIVQRADEIKVVDRGQDLEQYFSLPQWKPGVQMYLQPCYVEDHEQYQQNLYNTVRRAMADPRWRISAQLHRFLGIP